MIKDNSITDRIMDVVATVVLFLYAFICVYPFYYIFINTISDNKLSERGAIVWFPQGIHFQNYIDAFKIPNIANAAFISVARTVVGTVLIVIVSAFLGYMFTSATMWKKKFWYRFIIATMYFNAGIIPWYLTMMNLGLVNNFLGYILPLIVS
ncbi:MAG: carbohydrate ABC transporter permease, partial [Clostridiales bacterium]|nr:carbohydrate ABC transporter permease [Clostridiales bacterium]